MCGIIGFATRRPQFSSQRRSNFMEQGLYVNGLRGQHATGLFYGDMEKTVWWAKDAVDARTFLCQEGYAKLIGGMDKDVPFCVGHNRFATMGEHTQEDAHPFFQDGIAMVHNGTMRSYKSLGTPASGTSDSAHICAALAAADPGSIELLEKLDGDFALVWHDQRDDKLRVATNGRRPLSYLTDQDNMYFASEEGMLRMLVNRVSIGMDKNHEVTDFEAFTLYSMPVGELEWTTESFEDKWVSHYSTYGTSTGHHSHRDPYGWEDWEDDQQDAWKNGNRPTIGKALLDKAKILLFPTESKQSSDSRIANCNRLMLDWRMNLKAGDSVTMELAARRSYNVKANQAEAATVQKGQGDGFYYTPGANKTIRTFYCTVHQAPMGAISVFTDTVTGQLANAYVDDQGDLHLVLIFEKMAQYRIPVADDKLPKPLDKFFKNERWYYGADDAPRFKWVDGNHLLSARELDMILDGELCQMENCAIPAHMVPRIDIMFTNDNEFVCRDCTSHTVEVVDGNVVTKVKPTVTSKVQTVGATGALSDAVTEAIAAHELENREAVKAAGITFDKDGSKVPMLEHPPGSGKFVLTLPKKGPTVH